MKHKKRQEGNTNLAKKVKLLKNATMKVTNFLEEGQQLNLNAQKNLFLKQEKPQENGGLKRTNITLQRNVLFVEVF